MAVHLDAATLRAHFETDLSNDALERVIADADAFVTRRVGPSAAEGTVTEEHELSDDRRDRWLFPNRQIATVTSIDEYTSFASDATSTTLAADDWRAWDGGYSLERLGGGTNPASGWGKRVTLVYTPVADGDERTGVLIDLCKLAIQYEGLDSQRVGAFAGSVGDYSAQREAIVRRLRDRVRI